MLVPLRKTCFDKTNSFLSEIKNWYNLMILTANCLLLLTITLSPARFSPIIVRNTQYITHSASCVINYALRIAHYALKRVLSHVGDGGGQIDGSE